MRFVLACAAAVCLTGLSQTSCIAQDLKKGVTDLAHVDADYYLQGEYAGCVLFADGYQRTVGLQVVALDNGKVDALCYQGG